MYRYDYVLLALAALVLAAAFLVSPKGSAGRLQWAPAEIHLSGIHRNTAMLPEEDFPAH